MIKAIILSVAAGLAIGYFFLTESFSDISGPLITVGLSVLLFFVGMDLGKQGELLKNLRDAGWRVLLMPVATVIGTMVFGMLSGLILPYTMREMAAVSAGFGWYTLAPAIISEYSSELSAVSFLHNVLRELSGIILIPIVARYVGYLETVSLPGAAAMDVCLPIVEKATNVNIAVYSFITGVFLSILTPILVPLIIGSLK